MVSSFCFVLVRSNDEGRWSHLSETGLVGWNNCGGNGSGRRSRTLRELGRTVIVFTRHRGNGVNGGIVLSSTFRKNQGFL